MLDPSQKIKRAGKENEIGNPFKVIKSEKHSVELSLTCLNRDRLQGYICKGSKIKYFYRIQKYNLSTT